MRNDRTGGEPPIQVVTTHGLQFVRDLGLADRRTAYAHRKAIIRYLDSDDDSGLADFEDVTVGGHYLETRLDELDWVAAIYDLSFESLYEEPS